MFRSSRQNRSYLKVHFLYCIHAHKWDRNLCRLMATWFTSPEHRARKPCSHHSHKQEILPPCPECECHETIKNGVVKTCLDYFWRDGEKLLSLHCFEYGWPLLGLTLTRQGICATLPNTKLPHQVVDMARKVHANNAFGNYGLIYNNCEHFATFCRTDIHASEQTAFVSDCVRKIKEAREWTMKLLQRKWIKVIQSCILYPFL